MGGVLASQSPLVVEEEAWHWLTHQYQFLTWTWKRVEVGEEDRPEVGGEEAMKGDQATIPILTSFCRDSPPSEASLCPSAGRRSD